MLWWINKHKHSISIVHIFRVMSFKAFCKFLRRRNLAWGFWGVNFWSRDFWGVLLEALRIWLGFDFCPHSIIPVTWNPEYPQPWGEGELIHKGCCLIFYMYMYGLWGGHLFGGGRLLEREFILGNTVIALNVAMWISNSCIWHINCEATNHHGIEVTQGRC